MPDKKRKGLKFRHAAVCLFFLLNGLLIASPFVHASPVVIIEYSMSGSPVQQHNPDPDETNVLINKTEQRQTSQVTFRCKKRNLLSGYQIGDHLGYPGIFTETDVFNPERTFNLVRPYYYTFLSIYHLF